jgi:Rod binding domain-containing protein
MNLSATAMPVVPAIGPTNDLSDIAKQSKNKDPKAVDNVATGFESMFSSMLFKGMRQSLGSESMFQGDKSDVLGGMFDYFMGQHLAPSGSLGIAAMVKKQLMGTTHS